MAETEPGINDQAATLLWQLFPVLKGVENLNCEVVVYLIAGEIRCMGSKDSGEAVLLKEHLREPFLDGGEVEEGLSEDQRGGVRLDVEALLAKEIVPDGLLVIPVDEVAFLSWQQVEQGGEVSAVVHLITNKGASGGFSFSLESFFFSFLTSSQTLPS